MLCSVVPPNHSDPEIFQDFKSQNKARPFASQPVIDQYPDQGQSYKYLSVLCPNSVSNKFVLAHYLHTCKFV